MGHMNRRLGDAVHVDKLRTAVAMALKTTGSRVLCPDQCFTAKGDNAAPIETHCGINQRLGLDELVEGRRGLIEYGHRLAAQEAVERLRQRRAHPVRHKDEPAAVQERSPQPQTEGQRRRSGTDRIRP